MPSVPRFIADLVETRFGTPARVVEAEVLAPALRRVRFQSDELAQRHSAGKLGPGVWTVEFRAGQKEMRHYTACGWDFPSGAFDVLFFMHGMGPGRSWAEGLKAGDAVRALGPGSRVAIEGGEHVVIGDETSLGTARAVIESAGPGARVTGIVACTPATAPLAQAAGLAWPTVATAAPSAWADGVIAWLEQTRPAPDAKYYLTGHRDMVTAVGRFLLHGMGVARRSIHLRAHWAPGAAGL